MSFTIIPIEEELGLEPFKLTDWQLEDWGKLQKRDWSANWSQMGAYKTSTGLTLIERKLHNRPFLYIENPLVLIVTTRGGKGTYYDAIPRTQRRIDWTVYDISAQKIEEVEYGGLFRTTLDPDDFELALQSRNKPIIILSHYHCFTNSSKWNALLQQYAYDFILCDEAHRMKDRTTQWTRNIKQLKSTTGFKHVMTGKGFINNPAEMWSLLHFLNKREFPSYFSFRARYCLEIEIGGFNKIIGIKEENKDEFVTLRKALGPRRLLKDVRADIPEPLYTVKEVELNPTQRRMYDEIKANLRTMDKNGLSIDSPNVLSQLNRLRQITVATPEKVADYYDAKKDRRVQEIKLREPSSKLDMAMDIIDGLDYDQKIVVFSNFKDPIELLKARLEKSKPAISYIHLKESDSDAHRYEKWHNDFPTHNSEGGAQVFLSTLQLGGESINLTPASYCIFLDRSWSPNYNEQAVHRVYRPGQDNAVEIFYINARKTTDARVESAVKLKTNWFQQIFDGD